MRLPMKTPLKERSSRSVKRRNSERKEAWIVKNTTQYKKEKGGKQMRLGLNNTSPSSSDGASSGRPSLYESES